MPTSVSLDVNGRAVTVMVDDPGMPLLYALRDNLELNGPRFGCGLGQCGSCTVLVDGEPVLSCLLLALECEGRPIVTNLPATIPQLLRTFCALYPDSEAVVAGDELTVVMREGFVRRSGPRADSSR